MRVLVTGASGFVGSALVSTLERRQGVEVIAAGRSSSVLPPGGVVGPDLCGEADWAPLLAGCHVVVHTAARVHVMRESEADPYGAFRAVNVAGTARLVKQAVTAGVRRFIFISSVKALGETSVPGRPLEADDPLHPLDPYGRSKAEAEECLAEIADAAGMEWVVIRPPLVYGPGVKGNFRSMMRWLHRGLPLPLAGVDNLRSLVALPNLVDLMAVCLEHPAAANQRFLVSDGEDLSTPDLLRRLGTALGSPPHLFTLPQALLLGIARGLGRGEAAARLVGTLQVNPTKTRKRLSWQPPVSLDEALALTARHWLGELA
ncbi:MAG: NAD-dependent epimerase/dehydratase family protein [Zoogloeaceae bacterium]|nr:NAD-dependent epimerase/dehydratase family protein [Zoogloeaceae bacterium]